MSDFLAELNSLDDPKIQEHLNRWLDMNRGPLGSDERVLSEYAIRAALAESPELIERGLTWAEIEDRAP